AASFAQAGIYTQRPGGLAAYAEDAYGKDGYFQTFFLYFVSLAIANVAVAVSALGYLAGFSPALAATPAAHRPGASARWRARPRAAAAPTAATCAGVIGLLWLTSVANFGGPKITGRIGSVTGWGGILPGGVGGCFCWFLVRAS